MAAVRLCLLILILVLTGGMTLMNLNIFDIVFAVESTCDTKIQSVFGCPLGSANEGSFAIASAKTTNGGQESHDIGIDATDGISDTSVINSENNEDNANPNIESQIPSTIKAIPFP
jgi:hypothetical protein